jgi:hypothetical protein
LQILNSLYICRINKQGKEVKRNKNKIGLDYYFYLEVIEMLWKKMLELDVPDQDQPSIAFPVIN